MDMDRVRRLIAEHVAGRDTTAPPIGGGVQSSIGCTVVIDGVSMGYQINTFMQNGTLAFTYPQPSDPENALVTIDIGGSTQKVPYGNSTYTVEGWDYYSVIVTSGNSFLLDSMFTPAD